MLRFFCCQSIDGIDNAFFRVGMLVLLQSFDINYLSIKYLLHYFFCGMTRNP